MKTGTTWSQIQKQVKLKLNFLLLLTELLVHFLRLLDLLQLIHLLLGHPLGVVAVLVLVGGVIMLRLCCCVHGILKITSKFTNKNLNQSKLTSLMS